MTLNRDLLDLSEKWLEDRRELVAKPGYVWIQFISRDALLSLSYVPDHWAFAFTSLLAHRYEIWTGYSWLDNIAYVNGIRFVRIGDYSSFPNIGGPWTGYYDYRDLHVSAFFGSGLPLEDRVSPIIRNYPTPL
jgi:hypothetical protein